MPYKYRMLRTEPFALSRSLLDWWHASAKTPEDAAAYEREYRAALDTSVLGEIQAAVEVKAAGHDVAVLLCHEKPGEFCHRRLFIQWYQEHIGQEIPEL